MIGECISGYNECFVCGYEMEWETQVTSTMNRMVVQKIPEILAKECAVGRTEDGQVMYEIECICPRCKTRNKYTVSR